MSSQPSPAVDPQLGSLSGEPPPILASDPVLVQMSACPVDRVASPRDRPLIGGQSNHPTALFCSFMGGSKTGAKGKGQVLFQGGRTPISVV